MLHVACDAHNSPAHESIITLLATAGADGESRDLKGETALHRACTKGNVTVVKLLLQMGVDKEADDDFGWLPIHLAEAMTK